MFLMIALATSCALGTPASMYTFVFGFVSLSVSKRALLLVRWTSYGIVDIQSNSRLYIWPRFPEWAYLGAVCCVLHALAGCCKGWLNREATVLKTERLMMAHCQSGKLSIFEVIGRLEES